MTRPFFVVVELLFTSILEGVLEFNNGSSAEIHSYTCISVGSLNVALTSL